MANMASVTYVIEGPKKNLQEIRRAICKAINIKDTRYEEYKACEILGFDSIDLESHRLGGEIQEMPEFRNGVLRIYADERWCLQDFEKLLRRKFPDITVFWTVEEPDLEVFYTNDWEGKYFPERFWVDTCICGDYQSEYFNTAENAYNWLSELTDGQVTNEKQVEVFNEECREDDFIHIHEFEITD